MEGTPEGAVVPEPEGEAATEAAVERLGSRFERLDGQVRNALRRTRDHAGNLSSDRLQGLSEIVQNAEDLGATDVRILITDPSRDYYLEYAPKDCSMSRHGSPLHAALWAMLRDKWRFPPDPTHRPIGLTPSLKLTRPKHAAHRLRQDMEPTRLPG